MSGIRDLLQRLAEAAPLARAPVTHEIDTTRALVDLAAAWPASLDDDQRGDFEALARKVHVAKVVAASYGKGWKKLEGSKPLDRGTWPLLIAVFLAYSDPRAAASEDWRGPALKNLNAALAAIDRAEALGLDVDAELKAWSGRRLDEVAEPKP